VVVANESLLKRFTAVALPDPKADTVGELSVAVERLEDALRTKWIPNAFFYRTEQKLYEAALVEKGIAARRAKAEEQLLELKTRLEVARELRRMRFESVVTALLGAISVLALDPMVVDTVRWIARLPQLTTGVTMAAHAITVVAACVVGKRPMSKVEEHALASERR
jgi:hypothetical protein